MTRPRRTGVAVALLAALASCASQRPAVGAEDRQAGPPSHVTIAPSGPAPLLEAASAGAESAVEVAVAGPASGVKVTSSGRAAGLTSSDPYLRTAAQLRSRDVRVWFEIDLVAWWLDGPTMFQRAVQRMAELARFQDTVGFKVADELGYHDGLTTKAQVLAFLRATRSALARVAPRAEVLVDAMVPELGCLRDYGSFGATCARNTRATSPGASIDTVSTYLRAGLVDRLDLSVGLLSASAYHDRGLTLRQANCKVWRDVDALGWSAMTWLQARKALAMDGGWTGTRTAASRAVELHVDVPREHGANAVDIWTWRQAYDGGTYSLLAPDLQPNPLWQVLLARRRAGADLLTHVTPSTLSTRAPRRAHEYDLVASVFDEVFVAAGPI